MAGNVDRSSAASEEAGIFMWQIEADLLFGDSAIAEVFGLDPEAVLKGLPLSSYVQKVHPEDRPVLAENIARAIREGSPYNIDYRVFDEDGKTRLVMAMGRCFRTPDGVPAYYAGIVYPVVSL